MRALASSLTVPDSVNVSGAGAGISAVPETLLVAAALSPKVTFATTLVATGCDGSLSVVVSSRESAVAFGGTTLDASGSGRSARIDANVVDSRIKAKSIAAIVATTPPDSCSLTVTR